MRNTKQHEVVLVVKMNFVLAVVDGLLVDSIVCVCVYNYNIQYVNVD